MSLSMQESWTTTQTVVQIDQPERYTGLERIVLAAQGDLQRLLSAFFADAISVEVLYTSTTSRTVPATSESPIVQRREVLLKCRDIAICTATSTVTITSAECERLILDEKFAIGQTFRQMKQIPSFSLKSVELVDTPFGEELSRFYTLSGSGIVCDILEVFPSRDMFVDGENWLLQRSLSLDMPQINNPDSDSTASSDSD